MTHNDRVKRLLVTGLHGFVGKALARLVASDPALSSWQLAEVPDTVDLRDSASVAALVAASPPDAVIHLAAQSFVPEAFREPAATLQTNIFGTLNLLQGLQAASFAGRMVYVGTGDVYGLVDVAALPVEETHLAVPRNPYAVSKLAAEALCRQWAITESMDIVIARPFNHIGREQSERFVVADFARQVALIKRGFCAPVVKVGDIDVTRDFTNVDDVVYAYFALLDRGERSEVYNVCSGRERSVRSILERIAELAGVWISIETDERRMRRAEQRRMCGDASKIRVATGWSATTPLDVSLAGMLEHWESEV
ncbi:MAG TPA: GDP-mannose 4,6-dehydratase [Gemmatimonadaceae bacterium]|jgi:GDP-4-dehydro-6-deoxy-D-mannose reductase